VTRLLLAPVLLLAAPDAATAAGAPRPIPTPAVAPATCGDLLAAVGRKPAGAMFAGCTPRPDRQGKPLVARYTVAGRDAAAVEAYLRRTIGLSRLRRSCCRWDAPTASFTIGGRAYLLAMSSEETTVASRARWREIRAFGIEVRLPTEDV